MLIVGRWQLNKSAEHPAGDFDQRIFLFQRRFSLPHDYAQVNGFVAEERKIRNTFNH